MTFYVSGNAAGGRETLVEALRWMTVYESSNSLTPRDRLRRTIKKNGDLLGNSTALMATSVMTSLLGFVFWWVAARSFSAEAVGVASAAISAMTLIGTLGMFGMGTLLISELPRTKDGQWNLISTCVLVAATVSTVGGFIYVFVAPLISPGLRETLNSPLGIGLLIVACALNGAALVLDEGLVGLLAGHLQLLRNAYFAVSKLVFICILVALPIAVNGDDILATWLAGIVFSALLIALPLRARSAGAPVRPRLSVLRGMLRRAMDHNLLNIALFLPRICLPLVVAAVVSTRATAAFYTAWMVISFLSMISGSISVTLFAVAGGDMAALRAKVRVGLVIALGLGVPLSLGLALLAHPLMGLFGKGYVDSAGATLSILALTYPAGAVRQFYVAISRVRQRTGRASAFAVAVGLLELAAAWEGGRRDGLIGLVTWLAVTIVVEGIVLAPPVLRVVFSRVAPAPPGSAAAPEQRVPEMSQAIEDAGDWMAKATRAPSHPAVPGGVTPMPANPWPTRHADETAIIPLRSLDMTMVIPAASVDETAIMFLPPVEPRPVDRWPVEPRPVEPRQVEPRPVDRWPVEPRPVEPRVADRSLPADTAETVEIPKVVHEPLDEAVMAEVPGQPTRHRRRPADASPLHRGEP